MTVEKGLITYLNSKSAVTDLTSTRIYSPSAPDTETAFPRIVIHRVSTFRPYHLKAANGMPEARLQLECHASTPTAAKDLAEIVRPLVDGYAGAWGSHTIDRSKVDDEADLPDDPMHGEGRGPGAYRLDLLVRFSESVTTFTS